MRGWWDPGICLLNVSILGAPGAHDDPPFELPTGSRPLAAFPASIHLHQFSLTWVQRIARIGRAAPVGFRRPGSQLVPSQLLGTWTVQPEGRLPGSWLSKLCGTAPFLDRSDGNREKRERAL